MAVVETRYQKAKKDYVCNACEWLFELESIDFTVAEYEAMAKAKHNKHMIKKGQKYLRQVITCGGDMMIFKAIPEIHSICLKYNLYQDVC
jgi:hypothetical protein